MFATYFDKLTLTTRKHNSKTEEKLEKEINTADQKQLSFDCYVSKNTLFSEPPGVNETPKIVLNGRKPL